MTSSQARNSIEELALAKNEARLAIASLSIVDLSKDDVSSRAQLNEERRKKQKAQSRLQNATSSWLSLSSSGSIVESTCNDGSTLGRITLPCRDGVGFVAPLSVNTAELRNLHSILVQ